MRRLPFSLAALALLAAAPLAAQPLPLGPDIRVNTYTSAAPTSTVVAGYSGGFVVVWDGPSATDDLGISARRLDADGVGLGPEFRVNTTTAGKQYRPAVAAQTSGEFVVVWRGPDPDGVGIFGQRYDAAGSPLGGEFRVNAYTTGKQNHEDVAANPNNGTFVVTWDSQDGSQYDVFGQRYDAAGNALGGNFRVNGYTTGSQSSAAVAVTRFGDFLVAWKGYGGAGAGPSGVFAQRYGSTGTPVGSAFRVNSYTTGSQTNPSVATDALGTYLVAWEDASFPSRGVFARRLDHAGNAVGDEFRVDTSTTVYATGPRVAFGANDSFVVVWSHDNTDVHALRVVDGAPKGPEFLVNSYTTFQQAEPHIGRIDSGRFVVVWNGPNAGAANGAFARVFCFPRGDANFDGKLDVADVFYLINSLFAGGPAPLSSADVDGVNGTNVVDVFYLINYLFAGGPAPLCL
jgi:hypothetical protein